MDLVVTGFIWQKYVYCNASLCWILDEMHRLHAEWTALLPAPIEFDAELIRPLTPPGRGVEREGLVRLGNLWSALGEQTLGIWNADAVFECSRLTRADALIFLPVCFCSHLCSNWLSVKVLEGRLYT